jgi:chitin synthase
LYATYRISNDDLEPSPWGDGYQEAFSNSNRPPLVSNAFPFQRSEFPANEMYDDYEENKSVWSEDFQVHE